MKAGGIGVRVVMSVLELMDVANLGKILAITGNIFLKTTNSFEYTFVRFINFHKLQLYNKEAF